MKQRRKKDTNIHLLQVRYPYIKKELEFKESDSLPVRILKSESGFPSIEVLKNGKWNSLHSRTNPEKESENLINKKLSKNNIDLIIVVGIGYGYHIKKILDKYPESNILIIEPIPEILKSVIEDDEILNLLLTPNIQIHLGRSISSFITDIQGNIFNKIELIELPSYARIFPEITEKIKAEFAGFIENERINRATLKRFDRLWTKNIFKNSMLYFTKPGINRLENVFNDYTALVVCGGPSAEKSFRIIEKFSEKLCIIAVDTAVFSLIKKGFYPDFIVSVDPQFINSEGLGYSIQKLNNLNDKNADKKPILIIDPGVYPATALKYNGPIFICSSIFPPGKLIEQFVEKKGNLAAGGSVSVAAFDLARLLGCNPIVVTGLDLSYQKIKTHLAGSLIEHFNIKHQTRTKSYLSFTVKYMLDGGSIKIIREKENPIYTDRRLLLYKNWFENNAVYNNRELVNYSNGLPIRGFKNCSKKELFDKLSKEQKAKGSKSKSEIKTKILVDYQTYLPNYKALISFKEIIKKWLTSIEKIAKIAAQALKILEETSSIDRSTLENIKLLERFDEYILTYELENRLISMVMQNPIGQILEKRFDGKNWQENSKFLYNSIINGCKYLSALLKSSLKFINRLKNHSVDFENLNREIL